MRFHSFRRGTPRLPPSHLFQFSLWDSSVAKKPVKYVRINFQFSLWDSRQLSKYIIFHEKYCTFNSLYEILSIIGTPFIHNSFTFNSLYEIRRWEVRWVMFRWRLFQFSLWDSTPPSALARLTKSSLSILFMRFDLKTSCFHTWFGRIFQFSLWDSISFTRRNTTSIPAFQFSLWDSYMVKKMKEKLIKTLSILFMRFRKPLRTSKHTRSLLPFNSLYEIPYYAPHWRS